MQDIKKDGKFTYNDVTEWYKDGNRHRTDGPAYESDDIKLWAVNGLWHRVDGPAYIEKGRAPEWWLNDKHIGNTKEFQQTAGLTDEEMTMIVLKYGGVGYEQD
jgi:hypothetical protein